MLFAPTMTKEQTQIFVSIRQYTDTHRPMRSPNLWRRARYGMWHATSPRFRPILSPLCVCNHVTRSWQVPHDVAPPAVGLHWLLYNVSAVCRALWRPAVLFVLAWIAGVRTLWNVSVIVTFLRTVAFSILDMIYIRTILIDDNARYRVIINKCPKVNKSRANIKACENFFDAFK